MGRCNRCALFAILVLGSSVNAPGAPHVALGESSGPHAYPPRTELPEITPEMRAEIWALLEANRTWLRSRGELGGVGAEGARPQFIYPVEAASGLVLFNRPNGISNYLDQAPANPDFLADYNCGNPARTYDVLGYNHSGVDIFTWPWPWKMMAENKVVIVAAAPGTIIAKHDGFGDQSCTTAGGMWNAVYVEHADGSIAWYGHMKKNSLTAKAVGDTVAAGEFLGVVGSSGNSTGPHLHFEVYDSESFLVEPFAGACNVMNEESWWIEQEPYYVSQILAMTTGASPPSHPACPGIETPNAMKDFSLPTTIRFTTYYRDHLFNQQTQHELFYPDGSLAANWTFTFTADDHFAGSWWWQAISFPAGEPAGTYKWRATHEGQTYEHYFNVGAAPAGRVPAQDDEGTPLTLARNGAGVTLSWGASCRSSDSDYAIYRGTIQPTWTYNHVREVCSTAGETSWTFSTLPAANTYWLIVPRNATREGSHGLSSFGERPQPVSILQRCANQSISCSWP